MEESLEDTLMIDCSLGFIYDKGTEACAPLKIYFKEIEDLLVVEVMPSSDRDEATAVSDLNHTYKIVAV